MITEPEAVAVPAEISDTIGKLHFEIDHLQRELAQALEVWQSTLSTEKNHFDELLKHKELAWQEQENQWARQSQAYEERLELLKSDFESRLKQSEQNAAHALAELDDAWQRDKLEWGPTARDQWPAQRQALEEKVQSLERELAEKDRVRIEEREHYESRLHDLENRPLPSVSPSPATVQDLENQLVQFQQTVASLQDRTARSDELVHTCVQALDYQISVLYDLVHHYALEKASDESSLNLA